MRLLTVCLVVALAPPALAARAARPAAAQERAAQSAYESARRARAALMKDLRMRKHRDRWEKVIDAFLEVADRWPSACAAAPSLFNAAELRAELARVSTAVTSDGALALYRRIVERYPRHALADDAMMRIAQIQIDRQGDLAAGRASLEQLVSRWPRGDMKPRARSLLVKLAREAGAASQADPPRASREPAAGERPREDGSVPLVKERARELRRTNGALPLAQQLGLSIRKVAIDAGHGGHDTGGIGVGGVREKDIALDIARRLEQELTALGLTVIMIREDDTFLPLAERTRRANEAGADLFLSIHCNDAEGARGAGVETYYLDVTNDRYAMRLAARENAESGGTVSDLQFILADLATRANVEESSRLARRVQQAMVGELSKSYGRVRDRGVKHALFYVLLGAKMPAVLVETGFLSNPGEAKRLGTPAYRAAVARSIAAGVKKFLGERDAVAARL